ncbi:ATP-dependent helicase [Clostridium rectalis]|uniref:ATP-dependent helicase n=1 Tax=Clostridium rectalis TaxID=2040295 RepID=UPI000F63AEE4|nr:ATP-dependent helicase [Clostridium rectalis]
MTNINNEEFLYYLKDKCNINLTKEQQNVVFNIEGPMAVIAVPGAGKTVTLISRTANLILNEGVNPRKILAVSFSRASAIDMKDRFNKYFSKIIKEKVIFSTIHSFAYGVLRNYSKKERINYTIIEDKSISLNKNHIIRSLYKKYNNEYITEDKLEELTSFIGYLKNIMVNIKDIENYRERFPVPNFEGIYKEYELIKNTNNLVDYDDMLVKCYNILKYDKNSLNYYRNLFDYIEVDESQDTSKIQHEIIKLISSPKFNVCIVGDDDQSIYSWRGAFSESLLNFKKEYHEEGKILFMQKNFRSTQNIVQAANVFIKHNKKRYKKELCTDNKKGDNIRFVNVLDENKQIDFIIDSLKAQSNLSSSAVLFRNNLSSVLLIHRLIKEQISFYIKDSVSVFFGSWVLKDILNFCDLACNLKNLQAFKSIFYKMRSFIKREDLDKIGKNIESSVFAELYNRSEFLNISYRLKRFEEKFIKLGTLKPCNVVEYIENELNYKEYIKDYCKKFNYNIDNIENILYIIHELIKNLDSVCDIVHEIEYIKHKVEQANFKASKNCLMLSTIHSSKGLEFNNVYMIDLVEKILPSPESMEKLRDGDFSALEEETRLMYVGITRAKRNLYLISPKSINNKNYNVSKFVVRLKNTVDSLANYKEKDLEKNSIYINLKKGLIINHSVFGVGKVKEQNKDIITIDFRDKGEKKLSLKICEKNKFISLESN